MHLYVKRYVNSIALTHAMHVSAISTHEAGRCLAALAITKLTLGACIDGLCDASAEVLQTP